MQPSGWSHNAGKASDYSCWTIWLSIHFFFLDWAPTLCKQDKLAWGVTWIGTFPWTWETSRLQKSKLDLPKGEVSSFVPVDVTDWPWNNIVCVVLSQIQKVTEVAILESIMEMNAAIAFNVYRVCSDTWEQRGSLQPDTLPALPVMQWVYLCRQRIGKAIFWWTDMSARLVWTIYNN